MFFDMAIVAAGLSAVGALVCVVSAAKILVRVWFEVNASSAKYNERRENVIARLTCIFWFGTSLISGATLLALLVS